MATTPQDTRSVTQDTRSVPHEPHSTNFPGVGIFIAVVLLIGGFILLRQFVGDGLSPTVNMPTPQSRSVVESNQPATVPGPLPGTTGSIPAIPSAPATGTAPATAPGTAPAR